ncbi:RluA family pseudouridine synthase [Herbaspirillum rubrisubalbicans]|uniref:Pseudouridine synthase n=1 Tax=Herbaspirillum rubrisubalbicans Os34 TaxID=1235827 RepID=A0A6M3ZTI1_9BURK|nr:RluA family pseudouridine synthase [Herbaspirillum rubrisubalbicans]QJQ01857.1 RluA family pseudouridine synthase [Herbaspirillum rubrisubalbicans Os34]
MSRKKPLPITNGDEPVKTDLPLEDDFDDGEPAGDDGVPGLEPLTFRLDDEVIGQRLDKVLSGLMPEFSRSRIQQWIEDGHVTVDGAPAKGKMTMLGDELVEVAPQSVPADQPYAPEAMALDILHEDKSIIILNKPAGLVVHPAAGNWSGTLLNGLLHHCPALANVPRAGIVHRLDKETSGLMVVAKTLAAQTDLVRQLQARSMKRQYLALVWGLPQLSGTINAPMARHPRDRIKMAVSQSMRAKPAVTHYRRLATGEIDRKPVSLVHCRLETGRTHQIRVHLQSLGFALVGDSLYGKQHLASVFPRQALLAGRLGLVHPTSGKFRQWAAPLPPDLEALLQRAGIDPALAVIPEMSEEADPVLGDYDEDDDEY